MFRKFESYTSDRIYWLHFYGKDFWGLNIMIYFYNTDRLSTILGFPQLLKIFIDPQHVKVLTLKSLCVSFYKFFAKRYRMLPLSALAPSLVGTSSTLPNWLSYSWPASFTLSSVGTSSLEPFLQVKPLKNTTISKLLQFRKSLDVIIIKWLFVIYLR